MALSLEIRSLPLHTSIQHPASLETSVDTDWGLGPGLLQRHRARKCSCFLLVNPTLPRHPPLTTQFQFCVSTCLNFTYSQYRKWGIKLTFPCSNFFPFRPTFRIVSLFLNTCFTFHTMAICLLDYLLRIQFSVALQPYDTISPLRIVSGIS